MPVPTAPGPLADVTVIELACIGPALYACMNLADPGADVISADKPEPRPNAGPTDALARRGTRPADSRLAAEHMIRRSLIPEAQRY